MIRPPSFAVPFADWSHSTHVRCLQCPRRRDPNPVVAQRRRQHGRQCEWLQTQTVYDVMMKPIRGMFPYSLAGTPLFHACLPPQPADHLHECSLVSRLS